MKIRPVLRWTAAAVVLPAVGFVCGFVSGAHLKHVVPGGVRQSYLALQGDAPQPVRAEIVSALHGFQDGYARRDISQVDAFMRRTFAPGDEILLMGTDADEWERGYRSIAEFVRADWENWGDFRFAVDDSIVWSSGDVAWTASIGTVHTARYDRPVRFSSILNRQDGKWLFRQVHFQWDELDASPSDLSRPVMLSQLFALGFRYARTSIWRSRP